MTSVSVIIPARDAAGTIGLTLAGLAEQDYEGAWEVIVVDDGSRDSTGALAQQSPTVARVVHQAGRGPAEARNAGVAAATGDRIAFLDADCRPTPAWLRTGLAALADADFIQGATRPDPADQLGPFDRTLWVLRPSGLYESANLFVRRELFERIGGFEHWLGPRRGKELGEDVWFGWRARRSGARIGFCAEALAYHAVFARGIGGYAAERARLRFFPAMARRMPELRDEFFHHRVFLSRRSEAFDLALAGVVAAAWRRNPLLLAAIAPYAAQLRSRACGNGVRRMGEIAVAELAADAVGCAALLAGSARNRSLVL